MANVARPLVNRARRNWFQSYTDIILMILSIVQGLAFQDLAQRAAELVPVLRVYPLQLLHLVLCFVILLRILQTYIAVALDYEATFVSFIDVVQVFVIGILQYCLFGALGHPSASRPEPFHPDRFYLYLALLLFLAAIKYAANTRLIDPKRYASAEELRKERVLQWQNAGGSLAMAVVCLVVRNASTQPWAMWGGPSTLAAGLIAQTANSLRSTFGMRAFVRQDWSVDAVSSTGGFGNVGGAQRVPRLDMVVRDGKVEDVPALNAMAERLIPELAEFFGVSRAKLSLQLHELFAKDHGKRGIFGWTKWRIISDSQDACVAGALYLNMVDEKAFLAAMAESASIVDGSDDGHAERAEGCGYLRPFREDRLALRRVLGE